MRRNTLGTMLGGPRARGSRTVPRFRPAVGEVEARVLPAVTIAVDFSQDSANFFDTQAKKDLMQFAASAVGAMLNDSLSAVVASGGNTWSATFPSPATGATVAFPNLVVPANALIIYVGGRGLPGRSEAGEGSTGGYTASSSVGDQNWLNTVAARGQAGALASTPTDYGTWGGSIAFDSTGSTNWFFGQTTAGLGPNQTDFLSVAEHEIGHVLGLGTAPSWDAKVVGGTFRGANAKAANGGAFVPVNAQADHWAQSVQSDGGPALMTPALANGTRVPFTTLDQAALKDVGWQVQPVAPAVFQVASPGYSTLETSAGVTLTVTRTGGTGPASVNYATSDGTAKDGLDYAAASGTLNFAQGETSKTVTVPVLSDGLNDGSETFTLNLSNPSAGAQLGATTSTTLTIIDPTTYRPVGDFDGAGRTDFGVFRPASSLWIVVRTTAGLINPLPTFGAPNLADIPLVGDFDATGRAELAVFRPSTSQWIVLGPNGGHVLGSFGAPNLTDIPVPGDYDGVGYTEMAVFRPSTSQWFVNGPTGGHLLGTFGAPNLTDVPVPGDFDGTGKTEMAVFRPGTAQWFVLGRTGGRLLGTFGASGGVDMGVPGDYDGTGKTEMAVFRPSTSQWFVNGPTGGRLLATFGLSNYADIPVTASVGSLVKLGVTGPGGVHGMSFAVRPPAGSSFGSVSRGVDHRSRRESVSTPSRKPETPTRPVGRGRGVLMPIGPWRNLGRTAAV